MIEDLSILLNFKVEKNHLILRLDNLGLRNFELKKQSVCELIFEGFIHSENLLNSFQDLIGEVFEYEIDSKEGESTLEFWGDYGRIEGSIKCELVKEVFSKYTIEDLCQKGNILANTYSDIYERFIQNESINSTIQNKLKIELKDSIERFRRKAKFFEDKDKGKSEALYSQVKSFQKLLHLLERPL